MSASDCRVEAVGTSESADPVAALRDALTAVLEGLLAAKSSPGNLVSMRWQVDQPAQYHPGRHDIELIYREVFTGFRVPVEIERTSRKGVRAVAHARLAQQPSDQVIFEGYSRATLAEQYSPRLQIDMNAVFKQWSREGSRFRDRNKGLDIAYGSGRFETFDLFLPRHQNRPPVWIFIHGGYWQASDKAQHAQFVQGMLDAGYAVVMLNYGLAPETKISETVQQVARFLLFLGREADNLGVDGSRLHVAGHSAGGHLAAMVAARDVVPTIRSVLLLSGLFDLTPLALLPMGKILNLNLRNIQTLSPVFLPPPKGMRIALAVGDGESDEFKRQSRQLAMTWRTPLPTIVPGHHFSMLDGLNKGMLHDLALSVAEGTSS